MPDESVVHQFDCLAERGRFEVHLLKLMFQVLHGRSQCPHQQPPNSRSMRLGEHVMRLNWRLSQEMPEKRHNGQDVIWFSKWERAKWKFFFFFLYRSRSFGCYYSIPFVSYQKKEIGGGYCRRAPLVISSRYLICLLFFPRTPPPSPGRLSCVREYLGRSIKRQLRHAVRSNWRFDRHLHTNVFSVSFFPLLNLWKAQISSDDWRCPGHSYELHEAINRSRWEKESGLSCPFHKWEKTRHIARVCRRRRVKRDDRCPHWHSRQSWVGTRPGITKNSI